MKKLFFIKAIILLLFSLNCYTQWVYIGPPSGYLTIHSLAINGVNILAGTQVECFLSTNNGQNWQITLNNQAVNSLAISGNNIFAGTEGNGVYISTNNGQSWTQTSLNNRFVRTFAISGNDIFAGTLYNGVYLSSNNGQNWTQTSLNNQTVYSLATSGNNIFAGTFVNGIYFSTNNGQNWLQTSLNNQVVYSLSINGNNIFAGTEVNGVYISTNSGQNWTQTSLNNQTVYSLAFSGNIIFAGTDYYGVYYSSNNGENWIQKNEGMVSNPYVYSFFITSSFIYAGTGVNNGGVYYRPLSDFTGIKSISNKIPREFYLHQNYPNPFNPGTKIKFGLPAYGSQAGIPVNVVLKIYDLLSCEIATLVNEKLQPGTYEVTWNGSNYPSGVYYYRLITETFSETKKMILIK